VLAFDFRGHGASTEVGDGFWRFRDNQSLVKGFQRGKPRGTIDVKDFNPRYVPFLVNDIAAARNFLEKKNDAGECNLSDLVLIGAEDGAALGALWLASECHRYRVLPGFPQRLTNKPESKDVIGCVWLSTSASLGGTNFSNQLRGWLLKAGRDQKVAMAFVYGKEDSAGDRQALSLVQSIKPRYKRDAKMAAQDEPKYTTDFGVDKSKLVGAKLLTVGDTAQRLATYLNAVVKDRGNNQWEKRESDKPAFVWNFRGRSVTAKGPEDKLLNLVPLQFLR